MIVADAGPLIAFAKIGRLELLHSVYSEVMIPQAVYDELTGRRRPGSDEIGTSSWIRQRSPSAALEFGPGSVLHAGERAAIALALELGQSLLIDDHRGRRYAESLGVPVVGTLGTLAQAKRSGLLDYVRPIVTSLVASGYWIQADLIDAFLSAIGEASPDG